VDLDLLGIPPQWEGMRIAALSDFQLGLWDRNEAVATAALRRAAASGADLIVLLGDYLGSGTDTTALARVLAPIRGHLTLAVLGGQDARTDSLEAAVTRTLTAAGARVLENQSIPVVHDGDTAFIAGIGPHLDEKTWDDKQYILAQMANAGRMGLLLTHVPPLAVAAPHDAFPGVLAGNTVCGSVEVPGTPRLSWLTSTAIPGALVPGTQRLFRFGRTVMFVTCGLGYGFIPVRFGAPPEIAMVTLHPVGGPKPAAQPKDTLSIDSLIRAYQRRDTAADSTR
jgi:predicted MPP superfamily phosphohydrolase